MKLFQQTLIPKTERPLLIAFIGCSTALSTFATDYFTANLWVAGVIVAVCGALAAAADHILSVRAAKRNRPHPSDEYFSDPLYRMFGKGIAWIVRDERRKGSLATKMALGLSDRKIESVFCDFARNKKIEGKDFVQTEDILEVFAAARLDESFPKTKSLEDWTRFTKYLLLEGNTLRTSWWRRLFLATFYKNPKLKRSLLTIQKNLATSIYSNLNEKIALCLNHQGEDDPDVVKAFELFATGYLIEVVDSKKSTAEVKDSQRDFIASQEGFWKTASSPTSRRVGKFLARILSGSDRRDVDQAVSQVTSLVSNLARENKENKKILQNEIQGVRGITERTWLAVSRIGPITAATLIVALCGVFVAGATLKRIQDWEPPLELPPIIETPTSPEGISDLLNMLAEREGMTIIDFRSEIRSHAEKAFTRAQMLTKRLPAVNEGPPNESISTPDDTEEEKVPATEAYSRFLVSGQLFLISEEYKHALNAFIGASQIAHSYLEESSQIEAQFLLGKARLNLGKLEEAKGNFSSIISSPTFSFSKSLHVHAFFDHIQTLIDLGETDKAELALAKVNSVDESESESLAELFADRQQYAKGNLALIQEHFEEAKETFSSLEARLNSRGGQPGLNYSTLMRISALEGLSNSRMALGEYLESLADLDVAISLATEGFTVPSARAVLLQYRKAEVYRHSELDSTSPELLKRTEEICENAYLQLKNDFGPKTPALMGPLKCLSEIAIRNGKHKNALSKIQEALSIQEETSSKTSTNYFNLRQREAELIWKGEGKPAGSEAFFFLVQDAKRNLNEKSPIRYDIILSSSAFFREIENHSQAEILLKEAKELNPERYATEKGRFRFHESHSLASQFFKSGNLEIVQSNLNEFIDAEGTNSGFSQETIIHLRSLIDAASSGNIGQAHKSFKNLENDISLNEAERLQLRLLWFNDILMAAARMNPSILRSFDTEGTINQLSGQLSSERKETSIFFANCAFYYLSVGDQKKSSEATQNALSLIDLDSKGIDSTTIQTVQWLLPIFQSKQDFPQFEKFSRLIRNYYKSPERDYKAQAAIYTSILVNSLIWQQKFEEAKTEAESCLREQISIEAAPAVSVAPVAITLTKVLEAIGDASGYKGLLMSTAEGLNFSTVPVLKEQEIELAEDFEKRLVSIGENEIAAVVRGKIKEVKNSLLPR